jgi:hypothetical protein
MNIARGVHAIYSTKNLETGRAGDKCMPGRVQDVEPDIEKADHMLAVSSGAIRTESVCELKDWRIDHG